VLISHNYFCFKKIGAQTLHMYDIPLRITSFIILDRDLFASNVLLRFHLKLFSFVNSHTTFLKILN